MAWLWKFKIPRMAKWTVKKGHENEINPGVLMGRRCPMGRKYCDFISTGCIKAKCLFWSKYPEACESFNLMETFSAKIALALTLAEMEEGEFSSTMECVGAVPLVRLLGSAEPFYTQMLCGLFTDAQAARLMEMVAGLDYEEVVNRKALLRHWVGAEPLSNESAPLSPDEMRLDGILRFEQAAFCQYEKWGDYLAVDASRLHEFIQRSWFAFEDLLTFPEEVARNLLSATDDHDLGLALMTASSELKKRFLDLLEAERRERISAFLETGGPVALADVEMSQNGMIRLVCRMLMNDCLENAEAGEEFDALPSPAKACSMSRELPNKNQIKMPGSVRFEGIDTVCPLLVGQCIKDECLFWEKGAHRCAVPVLGAMFSSESGVLDPGMLYKHLVIMGTIDWRYIHKTFRAYPQYVRAEMIYWLLSTGYEQCRETDPLKKRYFIKFCERGGYRTSYHGDIFGAPRNTSTLDALNSMFDEARAGARVRGESDWNEPLPFLPSENWIEFGRDQILAWARQIVVSIPWEERYKILEMVKANDESIYDDIGNGGWMEFDDLVHYSHRDIQTILKNISHVDLILALKTAAPELKNKFFENMSKLAAEALASDLEATGPVRISEIANHQEEIMRVVYGLERAGQIAIALSERKWQ